nr:hypothetical protein [Tanacetum cinerariifolium]
METDKKQAKNKKPRPENESRSLKVCLFDMRQRCLIEFFSDYDYEIRYHPSKANMVADAQSRKKRVKPKRVRAMNMTHPGANKMYYDLRDRYWWPGIEKDIVVYVKSVIRQLCRLRSEKKGVVRFGKKGKLAPRFVRPFEIIEKVGPVAYTLDFLGELDESRKIKRYMYGLAPQIYGMVAVTEPKTMQKAVQIYGALTDKAVRNGSIKKVEKRENVARMIIRGLRLEMLLL